jgi:hypothetical protein
MYNARARDSHGYLRSILLDVTASASAQFLKSKSKEISQLPQSLHYGSITMANELQTKLLKDTESP